LIFAGKDRREVQLGRGGDAGSGPRGIGPDSMNLRRGLSVDHIVKFQFVGGFNFLLCHRNKIVKISNGIF
ncbi:MAG: hypothetical protein IJ771_08840, partial [Clostridia bacterium]|nr:hypothetical protein [Clostridia bacterium]